MAEKVIDNMENEEKVNVLKEQLNEIGKFLKIAEISMWARYDNRTDDSVEILLYDKKPCPKGLDYEKEEDGLNFITSYRASSMKNAVKNLPEIASQVSDEIHQKLIDTENPLEDDVRKSLINREERLLGIAVTIVKEVDWRVFESDKKVAKVILKPKRQDFVKKSDNEISLD